MKTISESLDAFGIPIDEAKPAQQSVDPKRGTGTIEVTHSYETWLTKRATFKVTVEIDPKKIEDALNKIMADKRSTDSAYFDENGDEIKDQKVINKNLEILREKEKQTLLKEAEAEIEFFLTDSVAIMSSRRGYISFSSNPQLISVRINGKEANSGDYLIDLEGPYTSWEPISEDGADGDESFDISVSLS